MDKKSNKQFQNIVTRLETLATLREHLIAYDMLIEAVRARAEKCTVNYTGDVRVQAPHEHDKIEKAVARIEEIQEKQRRIFREYVSRHQAMMDLTDGLEEPEMFAITSRYFRRARLTWPQIAQALGVCERTAYRVHDRAIWQMVANENEKMEVKE